MEFRLIGLRDRIVAAMGVLLVVSAAFGQSDSCFEPTPIIGTGLFGFDNTDASTDGVEHEACFVAGEAGIDNDLWFIWLAKGEGLATIETCGLTLIDSKIAVYFGESPCPPDDSLLIACNDDACGLQSRVEIEVVAGESYLLRVGTYPGTLGGSGAILISMGMPCGDPKSGDCFLANETPGCNDLKCCEQVCGQDPFCCDAQWDTVCADAAADLCGGSEDCNQNGLPDEKDIAEGLSFDTNFNGVPDECETTLAALQYTWIHFNGEVTAPLSNYGQLLVTAVEPADDDIVYINAVIDGVWAIQNVPLTSIDGAGRLQTYGYMFDLGVPFGTPVSTVDAVVRITTAPVLGAPGGEGVTVPVTEHLYYAGSVQGDPDDAVRLFFPDPAENVPGDTNNAPCEKVNRRGVPGVAEAVNHCAPGAFARSMAWLSHFYNLELSDNLQPEEPKDGSELTEEQRLCQIAEKWYDKIRVAMGTGATGTSEFGVPGIRMAIEEPRGDDKVSPFLCKLTVDPRLTFDDNTVNPCDMFDALKAGKDVVGVVGWYKMTDGGGKKGKGQLQRDYGHQVTVTGAVKKDGKVTIYYRDDSGGGGTQGDADKDAGVNKLEFKLNDPDTWVIPDYGDGEPGMRWEGFISVCPSRLVMACGLQHWAEATADATGRIPSTAREQAAKVEELLGLACNVRDAARFMQARLQQDQAAGVGVPEGSRAQADAFVTQADSLKAMAKEMKEFGYNVDTALMIGELAGDMDLAGLDFKDLFDCDGNDKSDELDIANSPDEDDNGQPDADNDGNGILDECECNDTNGDEEFNVVDLVNVILDWGSDGSGNGGDIDSSGVVDVTDLIGVVVNWGPCS